MYEGKFVIVPVQCVQGLRLAEQRPRQRDHLPDQLHLGRFDDLVAGLRRLRLLSLSGLCGIATNLVIRVLRICSIGEQNQLHSRGQSLKYRVGGTTICCYRSYLVTLDGCDSGGQRLVWFSQLQPALAATHVRLLALGFSLYRLSCEMNHGLSPSLNLAENSVLPC